MLQVTFHVLKNILFIELPPVGSVEGNLDESIPTGNIYIYSFFFFSLKKKKTKKHITIYLFFKLFPGGLSQRLEQVEVAL